MDRGYLKIPCSLLVFYNMVSYLPHTNNGIGDEDEQNNERLNERSDLFIGFLEPGKDLKQHAEENN